MNQRSPLRSQTVGIYVKPQRIHHRENSAARAKKVQDQAPRQPIVQSMRLDRTRHLLWLLPIRMVTKRIG